MPGVSVLLAPHHPRSRTLRIHPRITALCFEKKPGRRIRLGRKSQIFAEK
jgi:hypothetical protein